jgi:hypothetical protein
MTYSYQPYAAKKFSLLNAANLTRFDIVILQLLIDTVSTTEIVQCRFRNDCKCGRSFLTSYGIIYRFLSTTVLSASKFKVYLMQARIRPRLGHRTDDQAILVRFPIRQQIILESLQTDSGANPASLPIAYRDLLPSG